MSQCPCGVTHPSPRALTIEGPDGPEVFYDPHAGRQAEVVDRIVGRVTRGAGARNLYIPGNRGGGKSRLVRSVFHGLALVLPGFKYVIVRRNKPELRLNHTNDVGPEMRRFGGDFHQGFGQASYPNGSLGFFRHCELESDVEQIVGAEAAALFVDEAPMIAWDWLRLMGPSLRVPVRADGSQPWWVIAVYGGNPIGESIEELERYFIEKSVDLEADRYYVPADFEALELRRSDNPSLDEAEYLKQFVGIPAQYQKAWIDGVRMDARTLFRVEPTREGRDWHYLQELPTVHGVGLLDRTDGRRALPWVAWYRTFDMGFFPDPAVALWVAVVGSRAIVVREGTWFSTIIKDLAAKLREETEELIGTPDVVATYIDPNIARKDGADVVTMMDTLELNGVPCEPSINDRVLYADAIHAALGEVVTVDGVAYPKLSIYEPGCPNLCKYLPKMRWDEKNPRKMQDHKFDHWVVALAYFLISSGVLTVSAEAETTHEPVWRSWLRESQSRGRHRRTSRYGRA